MSETSASILVQDTENPATWSRQDTTWMLSLYGTAIGAGVLFLPINAGLNGIWPLIIMTLLAFPMTYFSHRALCRFVLSSASNQGNITHVVEEHFGRLAGKVLTLLYFFSIYPILLLYSVAITNTTQSFMINQLGMTPPPRHMLAFFLVFALMSIVRFGQDLIVRLMSMLVYPFAAVLIMLSLYLIPYWSDAIFTQNSFNLSGTSHGILMTLWLIIPVMVFSFNHSPIVSSFAVAQKHHYGINAETKCSSILKYSHIMMVTTVMFFVLSCVLSLSPQDLIQAKQQNISILSYLANHFNTPIIAFLAPFIAFIAIAKSFLGHYLGAREGLHGLIVQSGADIKESTLKNFIEIFMLVTCWAVATFNPGILRMIETLSGPVIAILLFLMPMFAIARVPSMRVYSRSISNSFVVIMGCIALSAIVFNLTA